MAGNNSLKKINKNKKENKKEQIKLYNNITVAIPFKSYYQVKESFKKVQKSQANMVELRFDYSEKLKNQNLIKEIESVFPNKEINELINSAKSSKIRVIFTLRRKDQGGQCEIPEQLRIEYIKYLMNRKPDYFDLEADIKSSTINELNKLSKKLGIRIIYSEHDWEKTPPSGKIHKRINELLAQCPDIMPEKGRKENRNVLKVIFTAKSITDNNKVLEICKYYAERNIKIICFCMGAEGVPSRVGSLLCGAFFSYASIGEETAPGQIPIKTFMDYLKNVKNTATNIDRSEK
ncbi:MAG: type I 3-dehydroquinate dehydratase [Promethearchaeota archaeon]